MSKTVGCGCDYCMSRGLRRDFRHSAEGGYEETPHHKAGKSKKKKVPRGCPGNDNKGHVYVWTVDPGDLDERTKLFYMSGGVYRREWEICVGCARVKRSRYTEEFQKLVTKYGWYGAQRYNRR